MRRCQDVGLTLDEDDGLALHQDEVRRRLKVLTGLEGSVYDAIFSYLLPLTVEEVEQSRFTRYALLARYGRQQVTELGDWEVTELNKLLDAVVDLIKKENEVARSFEDR